MVMVMVVESVGWLERGRVIRSSIVIIIINCIICCCCHSPPAARSTCMVQDIYIYRERERGGGGWMVDERPCVCVLVTICRCDRV